VIRLGPKAPPGGKVCPMGPTGSAIYLSASAQ
jgi:hypothetical protein